LSKYAFRCIEKYFIPWLVQLKVAKTSFKGVVHFHTLRAIYAHKCKLSYNTGKNQMNESLYFSHILGHDKDDIKTLSHYKLISFNNIDLSEKVKKDFNIKVRLNKPVYDEIMQTKNLDKKIKNIIEGIKISLEAYDHLIFELPSEYSTMYKKLRLDKRNIIKSCFIIPNN
jgi:hypothetical protein